MDKRFAIVIGMAAAGAMALGAQTAAAAPKVVKYGTEVTITREGHRTDGEVLWHGGLRSEARKCVEGRRVVLLRQRRGPDRRLGSDRNQFSEDIGQRWFTWRVTAPTNGRVYAKAKETPVCRADRSEIIENGDFCPEDPRIIACRADRSPTIKRRSHPRSLGAQTTTTAPKVVKYGTQVTMVSEQDSTSFFGWVRSDVHKCERDRFVTLFKQRPGADRKLGVSRSRAYSGDATWGWHTRPGQVDRGDRVYAKVERKVGKGGDVCCGDHSPTLIADE